MYTPKFNYSDKVVNNLVKIERSKTILENTELSYNIKQKIGTTTKSYDMLYFANILGLEVTLKDAEKLLSSQKLDGVDEIRSIILKNFKNVLDFNRSNVADTYSEFDKPIILHISKLMLNQWKETWEANIRSLSEKLDDRWDSYLHLRDQSIDVNSIEMEVAELVEWYKYSIPTIIPIVRIAIVMYRLMEIAPFNAGNKFILLGIMDYLFLKNGFGGKTYSSVVKSIITNEEKFTKGYEIVRKTYDLSHWIDIFTSITLKELMDTREDIQDFVATEEKSKQQPFLNLNKRQLKALKYLQNVPTIKREDYCHMMDVSTMTAFRDLNDLVSKKLIKIEGRGRGTKYKLTNM